jgi:polyisoprenoid-binding protein YceI
MIKKLAIVAVIALAALGGYFAYQRHVNKQQLAKSDAGALVTDTGTPSKTTTQVATGPMRTFKLADKSQIKWTGYKKVGRHSGAFVLFEGTGKMPGTNIEQASIDLNIETESCETDDMILTGVMKKEQFFHCEKFPNSIFKSVSITKADGPNKFTVIGDLMLRDVTKRISFPATITVEGDIVKLEADFKVNRRWWGIVYESVGDAFLEDDVRLELKAEAKETK